MTYRNNPGSKPLLNSGGGPGMSLNIVHAIAVLEITNTLDSNKFYQHITTVPTNRLEHIR